MSFFLAALFTLSSSTLEINEPLIITLTVPPEIQVEVPHLRGQLLSGGNFLLLEEKVEPPTYTWKLEPLHAGTFPLTFYQIGSVYTPIEWVTVKPFTPDTETLVPPSLPLTSEIPPTLSHANQVLLNLMEKQQPARNQRLIAAKSFPWFSLLTLLALLSLIPLAYWLWERRKAQSAFMTPEEKGRQQILAIQNKSYDTPAALIVDLAQALRLFIQNKYGISAPHQTTEEFLKKAAQHDLLKGEAGQKLALFLLAADQVKFARRMPEPHETESALAYARSFIS